MAEILLKRRKFSTQPTDQHINKQYLKYKRGFYLGIIFLFYFQDNFDFPESNNSYMVY